MTEPVQIADILKYFQQNLNKLKNVSRTLFRRVRKNGRNEISADHFRQKITKSKNISFQKFNSKKVRHFQKILGKNFRTKAFFIENFNIRVNSCKTCKIDEIWLKLSTILIRLQF